MSSNTMNNMREGGFIENGGEIHDFMENNNSNMSMANQQQMPISSQKNQYGQQGNGSTNQFGSNQFNQVLSLLMHIRYVWLNRTSNIPIY